ncbi:uncharacterized protein LOC123510940 isoform X3 [Portunus trituberculatus]|uniref:uncharacterized protein LOC123510940 isoform X3 n=1 Tax=Portunus trituberculatus TaxID=210409 RepID=UPI001E1D01BF|nr:uncharacterized protein LOC123510940 isoform X3 [Portunus trituberculatus]
MVAVAGTLEAATATATTTAVAAAGYGVEEGTLVAGDVLKRRSNNGRNNHHHHRRRLTVALLSPFPALPFICSLLSSSALTPLPPAAAAVCAPPLLLLLTPCLQAPTSGRNGSKAKQGGGGGSTGCRLSDLLTADDGLAPSVHAVCSETPHLLPREQCDGRHNSPLPQLRSVVHETAAKGDSRLPTGTVTMAVVTATLLAAAAATTFMAGNKINDVRRSATPRQSTGRRLAQTDAHCPGL